MSNSPFITKFAADAGDIVVSGLSESKAFTLTKNGTPILNEIYNYDSEGNIRVTGLADILSQAVYGELKEGEQQHACAEFTATLGETTYTRDIYAMRLQNAKDPEGEKVVLAMGTNGVCYPGHPLLITVIGVVEVTLSRPGRAITARNIGESGKVMTVDCDPKKLFPNHYREGSYIDIEDEIERIILAPCDDLVTVRFLNRYDMPECITARYMTEKPSVEDQTSLMYGRRTRFSVKSTTEYTLSSGRLHTERQYDTWQDLLTSRKAQLLWRGEWVDIVVTKCNYTRQRRAFYHTNIDVNFQMANPYMTL